MIGALDSILVVRRSIHIRATPERVWEQFEGFEQMQRWWGIMLATPCAGKANGQELVSYEPRTGGRVEMEVHLDGERARYGGAIIVFDPPRELTFETTGSPIGAGSSRRLSRSA